MFVRFVEEELKPFIKSKVNKGKREIFVGHSFGGLTVLYCLLSHPTYFDDYVALDPSLSWDNSTIVTLAADKWSRGNVGNDFAHRHLFLAHSGEKVDSNHFGSNGADANKMFSEQLKKQSTRLEWDEKMYSDETHGSISLPANIDALKYLFKK